MTNTQEKIIKEQAEEIEKLKKELRKKKYGYDDLLIKHIGMRKDLERLEEKYKREVEQYKKAILLHNDLGIELKGRVKDLEAQIERLKEMQILQENIKK